MFKYFESLVPPFPSGTTEMPPQSVFAFCARYSRGVMVPLAALAVLSTGIAIVEVVLVSFIGDLVDWLSVKTPETFLQEEQSTLIFYGVLLLVVGPALVLIQAFVLFQALMGNFPMSIRWVTHRYVMEQSMAFFQDEFSGRVATKVMQTALAVREAVTKLLDLLVYVGVYFLSVLALFAAADWRLTLPLLIWIAAYVVLLRQLLPKLAKVSEQQADARSEMTGRVVDAYANVTTVKLFSHAQRETDYARSAMQVFLDKVHPQMRLITKLYAGVWFLNALMIFSVTALCLYLWLGAAISVGAIAVAITLALRVNNMSQWVMWEVSGFFENLGIVRDGVDTISQPITVQDRDDAQPLSVTKGRVEFANVAFDYGGDVAVLRGLTLHAQPGEKVGIVGRSGAGKSTLVNLLLRFYDVEDGEIRIDDQDIRAVTQDSLRAAIGVVTQDTSLLHRSLRDNIAYGRPGATEDDIVRAARRAKAWDFISTAKDNKQRSGMDAHVGERGLKLSGGQRQRIAIARVMLKDAPILVLDEATSALDSEIEMAIQESLDQLMQGKTVLAIAHRLSTIAAMDRLVVVDGGNVAEEGTHAELIEAGGLYAELWRRQSGGFIASETVDQSPAEQHSA